MGVRLQRARNAVRTAIDTLFPDDFANDLATIAPTITTPSRLWCPACGSAKLIKTVWRDGSSYHLRCSACNASLNDYMMGWFRPPRYFAAEIPGNSAILSPTMSARELLDRTFGAVWAVMHHDDQVRCPHCATPVSTQPTRRNEESDPNRNIEFWCPRCGNLHQSGNLSSVAMNHAKGHAFWREEGQIRLDPIRPTTIAGHDAILITLSSVQRSASITFGYTPDATRLLLIDD